VIPAQDVIDDALAAASGSGADGCIVMVDESSHADVRFALNTTTTNGVTRDRTVTVIVIDGHAQGGTSVGVALQSGTVEVNEMVAAALADAKGSSPAEDAFALLDPSTAGAVATTLYDATPALTDLAALDNVLTGLAPAFASAQANDADIAGFAEHDVATLYLGTSSGIRLAHSQPTSAVQLCALSRDGTGTAWAGSADAGDDFGQLVDDVWRRLDWGRTRHHLDAGHYEVILPPSAVADMMGCLTFYALGGQDAEDGRTTFSAPDGRTRVGDTLSPTPFTLYSDPTETGIECLPFVAVGSSSSESSVFDNGLPLGRTDWIHQGKLEHLRYHRAGAARSGVPVAPYIDNLVLRSDAPGLTASIDDMVASTERGLLLTCLWYIREVDPITLLMTGLTRDGVYVIENGKVVGGANNFRFNESPVDLLSRATEVSTSVRTLARELGEYLNRAVMPALRIPDFNMSSVSQAS
jgi:predicted Zn-dependent protease